MSGPSKSPNHQAHSGSSSLDLANARNLLSASWRLNFTSPDPFNDYHRFDGRRGDDELTDAIVVRANFKRKNGDDNGLESRTLTGRSGVPRTLESKLSSPCAVTPSGESHLKNSLVSPCALTSSGGSRLEKSLGTITKKLVNQLKNANDGVADITETADNLEIPKRRIYDVINVMEGIGLLEKVQKNTIQWKGAEIEKEKERELIAFQSDIGSLHMDEIKLDEQIREMEQKLKNMAEDENTRKLLYVTQEDIKSLPEFQNKTVLAIKAPSEAKLEVADPDEVGAEYPDRKYKMNISSTTGPIHVSVVSEFESHEEEELGPNRQPEKFSLASGSAANGSRAEEVMGKDVLNATADNEGLMLDTPNIETKPQEDNPNYMISKHLDEMPYKLDDSEDSIEKMIGGLPDPFNGSYDFFLSEVGLSSGNAWNAEFFKNVDLLCADFGTSDVPDESVGPGLADKSIGPRLADADEAGLISDPQGTTDACPKRQIIMPKWRADYT